MKWPIPTEPPRHSKHVGERQKLIASGLQLLALSIFASAILAPMFNNALDAPLWANVLAIGGACLAESAALMALRYIPFPTSS